VTETHREWVLGWEARLLVLITAVLVVFGLASVYAASSALMEHGRPLGATRVLDQLTGALVGGVCMLVAARVNLDRLRRAAWPLLLIVGAMLLVLVLPGMGRLAPRINGARRWLNLGVSIQVSELAKLAVVIWTAMLCAKKGQDVRHLSRGLLPVLIVVTPLALFIMLEPDLSMAVDIILLAMVVLFAAGARIGHFILLVVASTPLLWHEIEKAQYRLLRMTTFLDPGANRLGDSYQITQSLIGVGTGGFRGVGFGHGQQKLGFLPYPYSDFIFASIAEEWGFIGVVFLVTLYAAFVFLALRLARQSQDAFRQLLGIGCAIIVGTDAFLHMMVGVGIVPTTGLALPFISHGRSALIVAMIATGLLVNLGSHRRQAIA
jgi:cell division protein FtsW